MDVQWLVVSQGMGLTLIGLTCGAAAAVAVTRLASPLLVRVSATDPGIFCAAALFLAGVALAATIVPTASGADRSERGAEEAIGSEIRVGG
jgi:hypothetical protein